MKRIKSFKERIKDLEDITNIQGEDGNWDNSEYMTGLYNGMVLSLTTIKDEDKEPKFREIQEDKVMKFADYNPTKYNGNVMVTSIMEWLRVYKEGRDNIVVPLDRFLSETKIDKDKFKTFVDEVEKTEKAESFKVKIEGNNVNFYDFQNNPGKDRIWEENE